VLAKYGKKLKPVTICEKVKEEFGLELTTAHASNIKSTLRKKRGKKGGRPGKGGRRAAAVEPAAAVTRGGNGRRSAGLPLQDIETLKGLMERFDAQDLKSLIDVLAK
jgi:hypothetical protein